MAMINVNKKELGALIESAIEEAIREEVEIVIAKAKAKLECRIPEIVAGIAIRTGHMINMEECRNEIRIVIKQEKTNA